MKCRDKIATYIAYLINLLQLHHVRSLAYSTFISVVYLVTLYVYPISFLLLYESTKLTSLGIIAKTITEVIPLSRSSF